MMRRIDTYCWLILLALATVAACMCAKPAHAQGRTDSQGNLKTTDATPDRTWEVLATAAIQNTIVHGNRDSTGIPVFTRGARLIKLKFYATFIDTSSSSNRVYACVLGVSVRGAIVQAHDSLSVMPMGRLNPAASAGAPDSIGSLLNCNASSSAVTVREVAVIMPLASGYPRGIEWIVTDRNGAPWSGKYLDVMVKPILINSSGAACTAQRINFRMDVEGQR